MNVLFRAEALEDVHAAQAWYDGRRPGLGAEFTDSLSNLLAQIVSFPDSFPLISDQHRRALLGRFPYVLYYSRSSDQIEVLACLHTRQEPG
ncbi:MAG: type II toxin-antitoxin system RelE/ParE family toxin, partial [Gemmatimonadota bacterium]